ncbi:MAG TPA: polysaccharide deacetylase family protein [Streptomyces sp.]|uniref:polysaccharide deacetylase family protein n=1 Tax=Streptomyces sp. TaxID=1931 RepID=UPI002D742AE8|nr:polysaccharide deacetylase family protein [Streptomyces sp.]HZG02954.1 polysaccharide deacetylase family protein [Streptomyces sp.]
MTVSVRRTTVPLTALALVAAAVAGCAGPGGDTTRAGASPAAPSSPGPASSAPRSPGPGAGTATGPGASASPAGYATLPASASGRVPVFRHGPRDEGAADGGSGREGAQDRRSPDAGESPGAGKSPDAGEDPKTRENPGGREERSGRPGGKSGEEKVVALTFDAVMSPEDVKRAKGGARHDDPALLATLRREKVPATVFMTGVWAENHRQQARAIGRDRLFEVGNLSYSHRAFAPGCAGLKTLDPGRQAADVRRGLEAIRAAGVENPTPYFRFPGGCHDDRSRRAVARTGVTAVAGDVVAADAGASEPKKITERVLKDVRPGSVVVLHYDRAKAPATERAVRRLVPELRERGYRFVRVSELIAAAMGRG